MEQVKSYRRRAQLKKVAVRGLTAIVISAVATTTAVIQLASSASQFRFTPTNFGTADDAVRLAAIRELVEMPFTYNILDPKYLKLLDSRDIATALLERERRFLHRWQKPNLKANMAAKDFPTPQDVEIISIMPAAYSLQLIAHGQLNIHQITHKNNLENIHTVASSTAVASSRILRAQVEDLIVNIRLEPSYSTNTKALAHYIRPKYGCVHFLKPSGVFVNPNRWLCYGELLVVYRDSVKQRTTYTYGDSHCRIVVETATMKHPSDPALLEDLVPPDEKHRRVPYAEAQVWGAIDLADIAEFRIPNNHQELAEALKPAGLPIYTYDREAMESIDQPIEESTVPIGRLHCVYPGNPDLMRKYDELAAKRQVPNIEQM